MIAKKTKSADLEKKRFAFFQVGLIVVGSATLAAFEYSSATVDERVVQLESNGPSFQEDLLTDFIPVTPPPADEQETPPPVVPDDIDLTDDDIVIDETDFSHIGDPVIPIGPEDPEKDKEVIKEEPPVDFAEVEPAFPGGEGAMMQFIVDNIEYPELAREMNVQGTVYVQFIVNTDGSIVDVVSANKLNADLEKEAIRVINKMPKWSPGEQAGKKVRVRYVVPINFVIKQG